MSFPENFQFDKSFEVGTATIADVNDAKAALDAVVAASIKAQNDLIDSTSFFRIPSTQ